MRWDKENDTGLPCGAASYVTYAQRTTHFHDEDRISRAGIHHHHDMSLEINPLIVDDAI